MNYDVITIGAATRDVFLISKRIKLVPSKKFFTGVGECVALGSKIELDRLVRTTGGGATNAAATFGSLGFKTATVARIGNDCEGSEIVKELKSFKVGTKLLNVVKGGETAYSTLLTEPKGGERTAMVYRGVSSKISEKDIPWSKMKCDWLYVTSLAGNVRLVKKLTNKLSKTAKICWNPGSSELKKGLKAFKPLLPKLFMLNMNREESRKLFKNDLVPTMKNGKTLKIIPTGLLLVITDGSNGAYAYLNGSTWFVTPHNSKVISRTGAGDAFGSGLVAGLMKGFGINDALKVGLLNSETVIQSYGAKQGVLTKFPTKAHMDKTKVTLL